MGCMINIFDVFFHVDFNGGVRFILQLDWKELEAKNYRKIGKKSAFRFWRLIGWLFDESSFTSVLLVKNHIKNTHYNLQNYNWLSFMNKEPHNQFLMSGVG